MIELHLIGYTEDGEHLVLDLDPDGEGRYSVPIDPDLLATVAELRDVRIRRGAPVDRRPADTAPAPSSNGQHPSDRDTAEVLPLPAPLPPRRAVAVAAPPPRRAAPIVADDHEPVVADETPVDADAPAAAPGDVGSYEPTEHRPAALAVAHAKLSPAEIQAQLRSGRSVRAVAADAGTDRAWIERWLPPIVAERERVLAEARRRKLDVPRARALGPSVDRSLSERGVPADRRTWSAARRADGRWRVSVRFEDGGRPRTATWLMDPAGDRVTAASPLAEELAGPGSRPSRRR